MRRCIECDICVAHTDSVGICIRCYDKTNDRSHMIVTVPVDGITPKMLTAAITEVMDELDTPDWCPRRALS